MIKISIEEADPIMVRGLRELLLLREREESN